MGGELEGATTAPPHTPAEGAPGGGRPRLGVGGGLAEAMKPGRRQAGGEALGGAAPGSAAEAAASGADTSGALPSPAPHT